MIKAPSSKQAVQLAPLTPALANGATLGCLGAPAFSRLAACAGASGHRR
jgi:hypothetical protein